MERITHMDVERLEEIRDEIKSLLDEAQRILRATTAWPRARAYWYAHMVTAIDNDHEFCGSSMVTMQHTIDEVRPEDEPEDDGDFKYACPDCGSTDPFKPNVKGCPECREMATQTIAGLEAKAGWDPNP